MEKTRSVLLNKIRCKLGFDVGFFAGDSASSAE